MDSEWIRNLAQASYKNGKWKVRNVNQIKDTTSLMIAETLNSLLEKATKAVEIFNAYHEGSKPLKVIEAHSDVSPEMSGFIILMGSIQLKNEIQCEIKLIGVPIIGTKVLEINLAEDFGIEREQRTKNGAKIELFGISTDIGRVKHIELDENEIKIKLGWITVPFDLNPSEDEDDGKGMEFRFCR